MFSDIFPFLLEFSNLFNKSFNVLCCVERISLLAEVDSLIPEILFSKSCSKRPDTLCTN